VIPNDCHRRRFAYGLDLRFRGERSIICEPQYSMERGNGHYSTSRLAGPGEKRIHSDFEVE
jgi:hypothetical protein